MSPLEAQARILGPTLAVLLRPLEPACACGARPLDPTCPEGVCVACCDASHVCTRCGSAPVHQAERCPCGSAACCCPEVCCDCGRCGDDGED